MPDDPVRNEVVRQFRDNWSRTRGKGRQRFAVVYGVVVWGALSALCYLASQFIKGQIDFLIDSAMIVAFAAGGYIVALKIWDHNEAQFLANAEDLRAPMKTVRLPTDPESGSSQPSPIDR